MSLKLICLLMLALFTFSNVNIANAKTEVARAELDYFTIVLQADGTYHVTVRDGELVSEERDVSGVGKYYTLEDSWQTKGYKKYVLQEPFGVSLTAKSDMTAILQENDRSAYGKWSQISSLRWQYEFNVVFTLFDDKTGTLQAPFRDVKTFIWSKVSTTEYQLSDPSGSSSTVKLYLYDDGNAVFSEGSSGRNLNGKWSGTINNPIPTPTPVPIQTIRVTPTPRSPLSTDLFAIIMPLLLLGLLVGILAGIGYWGIRKLKSKKQATFIKFPSFTKLAIAVGLVVVVLASIISDSLIVGLLVTVLILGWTGTVAWVIQYRNLKKQAQIEKEISRPSTEKADKEIKELVKADTALKTEHKAVPFESKQPELETLTKSVDVKTAFGYKGATILYKIKIENNTSDPISDIKVYPYVPDVFLLKEKEKSVALIEQGSSQTVTFEIRPTGECGECNISGRVNYYHMASRKRQDIELEPKSLSIVCPMLHGKEISEPEWHDAVSNLVKTEESTKEIDMPAETLFTMVSRIIKDMHMYMQEPEVTQEQKIFNGVARFYGEGVKGLKYAAQVEVVGGAKKSKLLLKTWAEKEDALTGFYHGVLDEIEKRVHVKEYIDDSIVQYNVHIGDRIGTQIKDSVVQRSNIGEGAKTCPNCGREAEANEKFCLECGAKL